MNVLTQVEVKALSEINSKRVIADTVLCWSSIIAAWAFMYRFSSIWGYLVGIPILGARYYALLIIGHDGVHRRLFQSRLLNDRFCDLFCFGPVGLVTKMMDRNHLDHHRFFNTSRDPDRYKYGFFNKRTPGSLMIYLLGLYGIMKQIRWVYLQQDPNQNPVDDRKFRYKPGVLDILIIMCWQLFLIGGLTVAFGWWGYFILWAIPVYVFALLADGLRSFCEHSQYAFDSSQAPPRLISYESNPIERFFISPMNMNFHAVHHLWVSIPYYRLPQADRIVRSRIFDRSIEWRGSYLRYCFNYLRSLPGANSEERIEVS